MKTVKLCLDFLNGPIWKDIYDVKNDTLITGIKLIDDDDEIQKVNSIIQEKYSSFYIFSNENSGCAFDEEAFEASKSTLVDLFKQLKSRLEELNDGSFEIEDNISSGLESIQFVYDVIDFNKVTCKRAALTCRIAELPHRRKPNLRNGGFAMNAKRIIECIYLNTALWGGDC